MPIPTARPLSRRPSGFLAAFLLCLGLLVAPAVQAAMPGGICATVRGGRPGRRPQGASRRGEPQRREQARRNRADAGARPYVGGCSRREVS